MPTLKRPKFAKAKTYREYLKEKIARDPSYGEFRHSRPSKKDEKKYV